jgi:hypothetical protein
VAKVASIIKGGTALEIFKRYRKSNRSSEVESSGMTGICEHGEKHGAEGEIDKCVTNNVNEY